MIVVKIGGGAGVGIEAACADIADVARRESVVVVHGGSQAATELGEALGHAPAFITAPSGVRSRYTDARTLDIFTMALGHLNSGIVSRLQSLGASAVGLSGVDGRVLQARHKAATISVEPDGRRRVIRDDRSGTVEAANAGLLRLLLEAGHVPVVSPPAWSDIGAVNVDGDRAAAVIAAALGARALVLLTNVPGLLRNPTEPDSLVARVRGPEEMAEALSVAGGRMRVKVLAARHALDGSVPCAIIADGRIEAPIARALQGSGTVFEREFALER